MGDFVTARRNLGLARALSLHIPQPVVDAIMDLQASILSGGGGEDCVLVDDYVADYGYTARCIQVARDVAVEQGKSGILFNRGNWQCDPDSIALPDQDGAVVDIPSDFRVLMRPSAVVTQLGLGPAPDGAPESPFYHIFRCLSGTSNVVFLGCNIDGEKPAGEYTYNHQSSGILVETGCSEVTTQQCRFRNLWGFTTHNPGASERIHLLNNYVYRCANSFNVNSDFSWQLFNFLEESEGIEASSAYSLIGWNYIKNALGIGISAGGDQSNITPGTRVTGNIIKGVVAVPGQAGLGIVCADNFGYGQVDHNEIWCTDNSGLMIPGHPGNIDIDVESNKLFSCGKAGAQGIGLDIRYGSTGIKIRFNTSKDMAIAGYDQKYGLHHGAAGSKIEMNEFGGTVQDTTYLPSATGTYEYRNSYQHGTQYVHPGASFVDFDYSWRGA
jgi:hypothetical protein